VHGSALPTPRPSADEVLTFEVALNPEGKKKAVAVRRQAVEAAGLAADRERNAAAARNPRNDSRDRRAGFGSRVVVGLVLASLVAAGWFAYQESPSPSRRGPGPGTPANASPRPLPAATTFSCDGRTHCSQMTSCAEATFFLKNCPGAQMDGNRDGVPCEQQWCTR
jgi:hypothetical protein